MDIWGRDGTYFRGRVANTCSYWAQVRRILALPLELSKAWVYLYQMGTLSSPVRVTAGSRRDGIHTGKQWHCSKNKIEEREGKGIG